MCNGNNSSEPITSQELSDALCDILSREEIDSIEEADIETGMALDYVYSLLFEKGVEDPEAYLREKGIFQ